MKNDIIRPLQKKNTIIIIKTMDKSDPPTSARCSSSRREKQPPLRPPPHCSTPVQASCDVASAAPPPARHTKGGRAVSLPPAGARGNQRSTAATAVLESTEVTPILNMFRTRNNAEIRAAIDNEARAFSVNDDDADAVVVVADNSDVNSNNLFGAVDGLSYFGDYPNPNPEDRYFARRENDQRSTLRQRRSKSSIKPSPSTSQRSLATPPPLLFV
jgi:hypothetical protein